MSDNMNNVYDADKTDPSQKAKEAGQRLARKILLKVDKGMAWAQKHPVAIERTILIAGTFFVTRSAYKKFALRESAEVASHINVAIDNIDKVNDELDKLESVVGKHKFYQMSAPLPFPIKKGTEVFNLQLTKNDLDDMHDWGMVPVYNVTDYSPGNTENFPLAVLPFVDFKKMADFFGFETSWVADKLLEGHPPSKIVLENSPKMLKLANENTSLFDQFFGKKS